MSGGGRWTKKAIAFLQRQIDGYVLEGGTREKVEAYRVQIVVHYANGMIALHRNRAADYRSSVEHASKHPEVFGAGTASWIRTCEDQIAEAEKKAAWIAALVERVKSEGLPVEVEAYYTPGR